MGYLTSEIFYENMLQLMRFSVYFKRIIDKILLFLYGNNDIIAARMSGSFENIYTHSRKLEIGCNMVRLCYVYIFAQILS